MSGEDGALLASDGANGLDTIGIEDRGDFSLEGIEIGLCFWSRRRGRAFL